MLPNSKISRCFSNTRKTMEIGFLSMGWGCENGFFPPEGINCFWPKGLNINIFSARGPKARGLKKCYVLARGPKTIYAQGLKNPIFTPPPHA